ncbi:MAG: Spy/CpxP family protein refolding chaperone [Elusimicrobia bacterium]|nr:Spy/CpxP family protein refolding chaperone [Elusimicrobiota bacterium]
MINGVSKKGLIIVGAVLLLAVGLFISKKLHHGKFRRHGPPHERIANFLIKRISSELELTERQQDTVNRIKEEILSKRKERTGSREDIKNAVIKQIKSSSFDKEEVMTLIEEEKFYKEKMGHFMIDKLAEFHAILTPEQKEKLAEKIEHFGRGKGKLGKKKRKHGKFR